MYMMDCFPGDRKVWVDMYRCLEDFYKKGIFRTIGVNIVYKKELEEINHLVHIPPMFIEQKADIYDLGRAILMHSTGKPGHLRFDSDNEDIVELAHSLHIAITSLSPLAAEPFKMIPYQDPIAISVAARLRVSPARLILKYLMQLGFLPLTRSSQEEHMRDSFAALDMPSISEGDMNLLATSAYLVSNSYNKFIPF